MPPLIGTTGLETKGLGVDYGGIRAAHDITLHAPIGAVTGLIGPNGAGKTTTFGACSGLVRPSAGSVHFEGEDITSLAPQTRAQRGIGRTFQRMELFDTISVRANVELGREAGMAGSTPWRFLRAGRTQAEEVRAAAVEAIHRCGLDDIQDAFPSSLSTGQRRLVELARVMAGPFKLLLLDEPSSGLDGAETQAFGEILRGLVRERGLGIFLVEHDMSLVLRLCDYIYVLDFGELIFEGTPPEVLASTTVQQAYLGSSTLQEAG